MPVLEKKAIAEELKLSEANLNMFWGASMAAVLAKLGVQSAVIAPGSRSAPLTIGFAENADIEAIPVLDERSAAFFALGLAKSQGKPVVLVCTSGTAAANFYPAVVEASLSGVPLIIITADRPKEFLHCGDRQAIDQTKLYGSYVRAFRELALPEASIDTFRYLRQTLKHLCELAQGPQRGPVHLNVPLGEPLAPIIDEAFQPFLQSQDWKQFFDEVEKPLGGKLTETKSAIDAWVKENAKCERGLIIAGIVTPLNAEEYAKALGSLSKKLAWPVLAEACSPIRYFKKYIPELVTQYDLILRNQSIAEALDADRILQIGPMPISKILRQWLESSAAKVWILDETFFNFDCLHRSSTHIRMSLEVFSEILETPKESTSSHYSQQWVKLEDTCTDLVDAELATCEDFFEGKVAWILGKKLPKGTQIFVANSMPMRDADTFFHSNDKAFCVHANRGANGIDGNISTAMGTAHRNSPAVMLTGDLTFLHDIGGLLIKNHLQGSLTIVMINNDGGGIFENLPISQYSTIFEKYMATPQGLDIAKVVEQYGIEVLRITQWEELENAISHLPQSGLRLIEIQTNRKLDVPYRRNLFDKINKTLKL